MLTAHAFVMSSCSSAALTATICSYVPSRVVMPFAIATLSLLGRLVQRYTWEINEAPDLCTVKWGILSILTFAWVSLLIIA